MPGTPKMKYATLAVDYAKDKYRSDLSFWTKVQLSTKSYAFFDPYPTDSTKFFQPTVQYF